MRLNKSFSVSRRPVRKFFYGDKSFEGDLVAQSGVHLGGGIVSWLPLLTLPFSKKNRWCQVNKMSRTLLMAFVAYGRGWDEGYVSPSPAVFNYVFDK